MQQNTDAVWSDTESAAIFHNLPIVNFGKSSESVPCAMLKACDACADISHV